MAEDYELESVLPWGSEVRRRRRERHWSARDLIDAIARASEAATGIPQTITPSLLRGIEEASEPIAYGILCLIAGGLGCDPVDLVGTERGPAETLH